MDVHGELIRIPQVVPQFRHGILQDHYSIPVVSYCQLLFLQVMKLRLACGCRLDGNVRSGLTTKYIIVVRGCFEALSFFSPHLNERFSEIMGNQTSVLYLEHKREPAEQTHQALEEANCEVLFHSKQVFKVPFSAGFYVSTGMVCQASLSSWLTEQQVPTGALPQIVRKQIVCDKNV